MQYFLSELLCMWWLLLSSRLQVHGFGQPLVEYHGSLHSLSLSLSANSDDFKKLRNLRQAIWALIPRKFNISQLHTSSIPITHIERHFSLS